MIKQVEKVRRSKLYDSSADVLVVTLMKKQHVFLLFALALLPRLSYILYTKSYLDFGVAEMGQAAISLARHGVLGNVFDEGFGPSAHLAPLLPIFLSLFHTVFGADTMWAYFSIQIVTTCVTATSIALLPIISDKLRLDSSAGLLAGILMALLPLNLWIETTGRWEQPYTALLLLIFVYLFIRIVDSAWDSLGMVVLLGFATGAAALLAPSLLPVPVLFLFAQCLKRERKRILSGCAIVIGVSLLCVFPWALRNKQVLGHFVFLRSNFGLELFIGNNERANGKTFPIDWNDPSDPTINIHPFTNPDVRAELKEQGEIEFMKARGAEARAWITENPLQFAKLVIRRVQLFWFPGSDLWGDRSLATLVKCFGAGVVSLLGLLGLASLFRAKHKYRLMVLLAILGPTLIYYFTHVNPRYRYPITGLLVLMSSHFLVECWKHYAGKSRDAS